MKDRDLSLDIIRILACFLVVFMHSPIPSANADGPFLAMLSYFTAPCIGLFFMVSGALLLPVRMDYFTFLKRRLSKVVIPTLVWTAIYLSLNIYYSQSEINILHSIASIPFTPQGNGVLWFMYTLIGLYLLAPILSSWVTTATDKELKFILFLWAITLLYPLLKYGVAINPSTTGILYYFTGYVGYFLLGYALKSGRLRISIAWPALIAAAGIALLLALKHFNIQYDFYSLFWYESIFIAGLCCSYWILLRKSYRRIMVFGGTATKIVATISNLSFGVYLSHILIMRYILWKAPIIYMIDNYTLQTMIIALVS
ncbi:MAG: acyltransferase, partial [Muribaculum sp.]|nr:acyltransferase [Muribaculum sp.]